MDIGTTTKKERNTEESVKNDDLLDDEIDELFNMADNIRGDELYNVEIIDWEKKGDKRVEVKYKTINDNVESDVYDWPIKPTEDNKFVQVLMVALGLSDPAKAVSRADALKKDGDSKSSTVPADRYGNSSWGLKPDADLSDKKSSADDTSSLLDIYGKILCILLGPITLTTAMLFFMDEIIQWDKYEDNSLEYISVHKSTIALGAQISYYSYFGSVLWIVFFASLML